MLTLTPEKLPVTVYKSTDLDAPILDRSPNCVATIFKACLVTGYGTKQSAGWSMPFEDNDRGIKVLRPKVGADTDFYLRLSNDTGQEMTAQVFTQMTTIDGGTKQLECDTPFTYGYGEPTDKWLMIASPRGFWFLCEQYRPSLGIPQSKAGAYLFCGDTQKDHRGHQLICLQHTGGSWAGAYNSSPLDQRSSGKSLVAGKLYDVRNNGTADVSLFSLFNGQNNVGRRTQAVYLSPLHLFYDESIFTLPGVYAASNTNKNNFDIHTNQIQQDKIVFGLSSYNNATNFYFDSEYWLM